MAEEVELDLEQLDREIEGSSRVEKRIKDLSGKLRDTSEKFDEVSRASEEKDSKIANLEKENSFLSSFGDTLKKFPNASDFRDQIKEKVLNGYSVEDAAVAVLAKEGKLTMEQPKPEAAPAEPAEPAVQQPSNPAGGSAVNQPTIGGEKPVSEMTQEEKRAALIEAEKRGELGVQ